LVAFNFEAILLTFFSNQKFNRNARLENAINFIVNAKYRLITIKMSPFRVKLSFFTCGFVRLQLLRLWTVA
jgi:hypothetical protein